MFLLLLLLPLVFTALMPRRWLFPWFSTLLLGFGLCWWDFSRSRGGAGDLFGLGFLMLMFLAVLAVGAVRVALARWRRKSSATDGDSHGVRLYVAGLSGLVFAAALTFGCLQLVDLVWPYALALHLGVVTAGGLVWLLTPRLWPWPPTGHRMQVHTAFRGAGVLYVVGALAWSLVSVPTKIQSAQQAAQGQPYCLQSATPRGLQAVANRLDLSGFAAWAGRGGERHARMALGSGVQTDWRYWSYRDAAWEPDSLQGVLTCQPVVDQAKALPWWAPASARGDAMRFRMAGVSWSVPWSLLPTTYGEMPSFQYLPRSAKGMSSTAMSMARVNVRLCVSGRIHPWFLAPGPGDQLRTLQQAHGLVQEEIVTVQRAIPHVQWVARDAAGRVTSWMQCHAGSSTCHHAFKRDGIVLEFMHPESALPSWQQLEQEQWAQLRGFAPEGLPACGQSAAPAP